MRKAVPIARRLQLIESIMLRPGQSMRHGAGNFQVSASIAAFCPAGISPFDPSYRGDQAGSSGTSKGALNHHE
jgi:hypothetical protein